MCTLFSSILSTKSVHCRGSVKELDMYLSLALQLVKISSSLLIDPINMPTRIGKDSSTSSFYS